jgi:hypothetical protein
VLRRALYQTASLVVYEGSFNGFADGVSVNYVW